MSDPMAGDKAGLRKVSVRKKMSVYLSAGYVHLTSPTGATHFRGGHCQLVSADAGLKVSYLSAPAENSIGYRTASARCPTSGRRSRR